LAGWDAASFFPLLLGDVHGVCSWLPWLTQYGVIKIVSEENSKWDHWVMQTAERIVDMLDRNGKSLQGNLSDVLLVVLPRP
jgi:hypothetical protein